MTKNNKQAFKKLTYVGMSLISILISTETQASSWSETLEKGIERKFLRPLNHLLEDGSEVVNRNVRPQPENIFLKRLQSLEDYVDDWIAYLEKKIIEPIEDFIKDNF